jgi:O-antigen/teichoic acid export membrane protein
MREAFLASHHPRATDLRSLPLRLNFSWTLVGNVTYAGCQWGLLAVLAKLGSPEVVGQYALALAIVNPVFLLVQLPLRSIQASDKRGAYGLGDYLGLRAVTTLLAILAAATCAWFSGFDGPSLRVMLALAGMRAFEGLSDVCYGHLQRNERMDRISQSMIVRGAVNLAAIMSIFLIFRSLPAAICATFFTTAICVLCWDLPVLAGTLAKGKLRIWEALRALRGLWNFDAAILKGLAACALPLGIVAALASLSTNIPRYFLEAHGGRREVGIFAALGYVNAAACTVINALAQSAMPRIAATINARDGKSLTRLLLRLLTFAAALGCTAISAAVLVGRPVLHLLYGPEYAEHTGVFIWLITSGAITYLGWFIGDAMTAARRLTIQMPIFFVSVSINLVGCWLGVARFGMQAAAITLLAANLAQVLMSSGVVLSVIRDLTKPMLEDVK